MTWKKGRVDMAEYGNGLKLADVLRKDKELVDNIGVDILEKLEAVGAE